VFQAGTVTETAIGVRESLAAGRCFLSREPPIMHILNVQKLTDEKWVNLFAAAFEHQGRRGRWVFASRKAQPHTGDSRGDAVIIVPILRLPGEPPRLVLVKEFRVPVGGYVLGFPAGLLEPGEAVEDTARREMLEETGMEVVHVKRVTQPLFSSSGLTDEAAAMAFVDVRTTAQTRPALEASEDLEVLLLDFPAVCRLCDDPAARMDAKVWTVLYLYRQLGGLV
jgi:ADP-ribose pyrophosphatase